MAGSVVGLSSGGLLLTAGPGHTSEMTSTIVVGASVAGLLTARVLSDLVDEVVVLERERLTDAAPGCTRPGAIEPRVTGGGPLSA